MNNLSAFKIVFKSKKIINKKTIMNNKMNNNLSNIMNK